MSQNEKLQDLISKYFSLPELRVMFHSLGIDIENFVVNQKEELVLDLIKHVHRHFDPTQKQAFLNYLKSNRPHVSQWRRVFVAEYGTHTPVDQFIETVKGPTTKKLIIIAAAVVLAATLVAIIGLYLTGFFGEETDPVVLETGVTVSEINSSDGAEETVDEAVPEEPELIDTETVTPTVGLEDPTPTFTIVPSITPIVVSTLATTSTVASTHTATPTITPTHTATSTITPTHTATATSSPTATSTPTSTPTNTPTSTPTQTPTPARTLTPTKVSNPAEDDGPFMQIGVTSFTQVYGGPSTENPVLRNIMAGEVYPILTTVRGNEFVSIWISAINNVGWVLTEDVEIDPRIDLETIPLDPKFHGPEHGPTPTAGPVATLTSTPTIDGSQEKTPTPVIGDRTITPEPRCQMRVEMDLSSPAGDFSVRWFNLPSAADNLFLLAVSMDSNRSQNLPLIEGNPIDNFALNQGSFSMPRDRFSERKYQIGDSFRITLEAFDQNGVSLCTDTVDFTWNGEGL